MTGVEHMSYPFRFTACFLLSKNTHPLAPIVAMCAGGTSNIRQKRYTNQILGRILLWVTFRGLRRTEEKGAEEDDLRDQQQHERQRVGCKER